MDRTRDLLNLSYVQRWVIAPMHRPQSVAEHSYRVAVIVMGLHSASAGIGTGFDLERAVSHALIHDADEVFSGDVPGTDKDAKGKKWPDPAHMLRWEIAVKVADSLETWDWWKKHGDQSWTHPNSPKEGDKQRDIRKILWYTEGNNWLLVAAKQVMVEAMGYETHAVDALFRRVSNAG